MVSGKSIWVDGEMMPWEDASTHVLTHALHYGTGIFEGIRSYDTAEGPAVFRSGEHYERLHRSADAIDLPLKWAVDELRQATKDVLRANGLAAGYIRPIAYFDGVMGLATTNAEVHTAIAAWEWGTYLGEEGVRNGIRAKISSWRRYSPASIPNVKVTGVYINSVLAKMEVVRAGYDEAVMLNGDGMVSEGTGENIFMVKDGVAMTPPLSVGCLEGITRDTIMTLLGESDVEVQEAELTPDALYEADEIFLTGTAAEVTPIRELDDHSIGSGKPGPVTRVAQQLYEEAVTGRLAGHGEWLDLV
jgi:branched-chain amino acid aminotransferase